MSISYDYEKYDFCVDFEEIEDLLKKAIENGYIPHIIINGYFYDIKYNKRNIK